MTLRNLPKAKAPNRPNGFQWDAPSDTLAKWADLPFAAADDDGDTVISIYDVIGTDWWTGEGVTAKSVARALDRAAGKPVTARINTPGGDMFEGLAIYNLLVEYSAKVTVEVMGIAASAGSVIAMAGDEIIMGLGTSMMIHNAWGVVIGNRNDMRAAADIFEGFDSSMADIYEARTGLKKAEVAKLMDAESYIFAKDAVEKGFADKVSDKKPEPSAKNRVDSEILARRRVEAALAKDGVVRSERAALLNSSMSGPRDATRPAARDAGLDPAAVQRVIDSLKN